MKSLLPNWTKLLICGASVIVLILLNQIWIPWVSEGDKSISMLLSIITGALYGYVGGNLYYLWSDWK